MWCYRLPGCAVIFVITPSPCFIPVYFAPFFFNSPCQFTPLLNLRSFIFGLTPFGWLYTWTLQGEYESHGEEQSWEAGRSWYTRAVTVCSPLSSDHLAYLNIIRFFVLPINTTMTQPIEEEKKLTQRWKIPAILLTVVTCIICGY